MYATIKNRIDGAAIADYSGAYFGFSLDYATGDPYGYSNAQSKDNNSDSLVYYYRGDYSFTASVIGFDGGNESDIQLQPVNIEPYSNAVHIVNWVNESGYSQAVLRGESNYDFAYSVGGSWSADEN